MKQRNKLYIGYVVFLVCLFVPLIGSASFTNSNSQMSALERYRAKNFLVENNASDEIDKHDGALVNFLPVSKEPPVLNGNIVGQALSGNASLLNWNKPIADLEIEKIIVYRTASADENGLPVPSVGTGVELAGNSTRFLDNDIEIGVTYEYYIKAVDIEGNESEVSNVVVVTTDESYDGVHNADRGVGEVTATEATLNIGDLPFNEYRVLGFYKGLSGGAPAWENISARNTFGGVINVDLNAGFLHHFVVVPLDGDGNILSAGEIITVVAPPHAPENLQVTNVTHNFVTLTWENTNDLESIEGGVVTEIYRSDPNAVTPNDLDFLMDVNVENNTFTDLGVKFDQEYTYAVKTRVGADNRSEFSNMVKVITLLPEVGNLQTGDIGADSIEITWENAINDPIVVNDKGIVHDIYRDGTLISDGEVSGNDNSFIDEGLNALTSYKYHIVTRSNNSNSKSSGTLEVTTRPHEPRNLRATNITHDSITLEWDDPNITDNVTYLIRRDDEKDVVTHENIFIDPRLAAISSHNYKVVIRVGEDNYSIPSSINVTTRPEAPQNLTATEVTPDSVTLEWENINDFTTVTEEEEVVNEIYRDGDYLDKAAGSDQTFTDSTVAQGNTYTYTVVTRVGIDNKSVDSNAIIVKVNLVIPPVENLRATDVRGTEVEIMWDNTIDESIPAGDIFHKVYRGKDELDVAYGWENSYRDTGLNALTDYEYHIVTLVVTDNVTSAPSDVLKVTTLAELNAPDDLKATEVTISSVKLEWTNPNRNIANAQQDIYRDGTILEENIGDVSQFTDITASFATTYRYRVVARRGSEGLASNTIAVTTLARLNAPSGLRTTEVTISGAKFEWANPNSGVANVQQDIYRDGTILEGNIGNVSQFTDTTALPGTTYEYKVVARRGGEELASNTITVTTLARLNVPSNLRATGVAISSVKLEWTNPNSNVANTQQDIYRDDIILKRNIGGSVSQFTDSTALSATAYKYKVVVRRGSEEVTSDVLSVTTVPKAPSNLKEIGVTESSVALVWENNNSTALTIYNDIYRDTTLLKTVSGTDTSYIDSQVVAGRTYTYTVRARIGDDNRSVASNGVVVRVKGLAPVANLRMEDVYCTLAKLRWDNTLGELDLKDVTHYIYFQLSPDHVYLLTSVPGTVSTYQFTGNNASGVFHYYVVTKMNDGSLSSAKSNIAELKVPEWCWAVDRSEIDTTLESDIVGENNIINIEDVTRSTINNIDIDVTETVDENERVPEFIIQTVANLQITEISDDGVSFSWDNFIANLMVDTGGVVDEIYRDCILIDTIEDKGDFYVDTSTGFWGEDHIVTKILSNPPSTPSAV